MTYEEQAEERYPDPSGDMLDVMNPDMAYDQGKIIGLLRNAYVTCLRERVAPLEAEIAELKDQIECMGNELQGQREIIRHHEG
jgi:hypothetical protein